MARIIGVFVLAFAVMAGVVLYRTSSLEAVSSNIEAQPPVAIDTEAAAEHLSQLIRFKSLSTQQGIEPDAFLEIHRWLEDAYPALHQTLSRETVNELSLLYTWTGTDPTLKPILLNGHLDVVPVEPGTEDDWTYPPYSGAIADGYVWGRGAIDMKGTVVGILEAIEHLAKTGFRPKRTVYLVLGHDEEIGGANGAGGAVDVLEARGVALEFSLDEGSTIAMPEMTGAARPYALVNIAEKGWVTLEITAHAEGGHSSMPPAHESTATGRLARAIVRLEENRFEPSLDGPAREMVVAMAPDMEFMTRMAVANLWLFEPIVVDRMTRVPRLNALLRTTTAPTMLWGSAKENVLPIRARAFVNFRIHPRDTVDGVIAHAERVIDDPKVTLKPGGLSITRNASPVSSLDNMGYAAIRRSIHETFGDIGIAPGMTTGGTDSKHFKRLTDNTYRFIPLPMGPDDTKRIHGTNERFPVDAMADFISFYVRFFRHAAG